MEAKTRRQTLRLISNGVYVLTSRCKAQLGAATVSWVSQASFQPPLLMAAVRRESNVFKCLAQSGVAALHVVAKGQEDKAHAFFYPTRAAPGTINGEPYADGATVAPILTEFPAHVECRVEQIVETGGDHAIVVLRVVEAACSATVRPLTIADTAWEYGG